MISGRKECRSGEKPCTPSGEVAGREALYCQATHSVETRTAIAEAMKVNPSTLGKWVDPFGDERIPEDRREELLRLTKDNPAYARYIATTLQDFVVYDPRATVNTGRMVSEFADLLKAIDARADGTSVDEADRIEKEGNELIAAVRIEIESARAAVSTLRAVK
jgi:transposase-like protein